MSLYRRFHDRFGTAGVVIGAIALILALSGSALAASGALTGKQKKEVEKIAKKFAGKPGAPGPQGAVGPQGAAGANGKDGANGSNGADGEDGATGAQGPQGNTGSAGATGAQGPAGPAGPQGPQGDPGLEGPQGPQGSPWALEGTLPVGATETGAWSGMVSAIEPGVSVGIATLSFPIPLASAIDTAHTKLVPKGGSAPEECEDPDHPGTAKPTNPEADSGYLCVYVQADLVPDVTIAGVYQIDKAGVTEGASTAGSIVQFESEEPFNGVFGTFAVTG